jgi:uncharacterized protein (TIGR03382 family)
MRSSPFYEAWSRYAIVIRGWWHKAQPEQARETLCNIMRSLLLVSALLAWPLSASAHIHLTAPLSRSDSVTGDQKGRNCGVLDQVRTNRITTFKPGETITVTWSEPIQHPGYFRIAFQPDGASFQVPAAGPSPGNVCTNAGGSTAACPAAGVACGHPPLNGNDEGPSEGGSIILKDRIPDGTLSTQITLPNMECTNCTLQLIQVMHDKCPYTIETPMNQDASDDIYFNCADIVLSNGAPGVDAGNTEPDAPGGTGGNPTTSGGCSTGGGAGLLVGFALLGLVIKRRR